MMMPMRCLLQSKTALPNAVRMMASSNAPELHTFASYAVRKSKAAMSIKPIAPTFKATAASRLVEKEGSFLLEFAGATEGRAYDWANKQVFALKVSELGDLLALERSKSIEFVHDPTAFADHADKPVRRLKISPTSEGNGVFWTLQVSAKGSAQAISYTVPVTWGEMEVVKACAQTCIPRMLGFDKVF